MTDAPRPGWRPMHPTTAARCLSRPLAERSKPLDD
jgi:hypothetical protein